MSSSGVLAMPHLRTKAGVRVLTGTYACGCHQPFVLIIDPVDVHCGHCRQRFHDWADGSLHGLEITCADGVLTIRLDDFDVTLHRCGDDDALLEAIDQVIERANSEHLQEVPC